MSLPQNALPFNSMFSLISPEEINSDSGMLFIKAFNLKTGFDGLLPQYVNPIIEDSAALFSIPLHTGFTALGKKRTALFTRAYLSFKISSRYSDNDTAVLPSLPTVVSAQTMEFRIASSTESATARNTRFR